MKVGLFNTDDLLGSNIIEHLEACKKANETTRHYYYSVSKLFRAIQKYIYDSSNNCSLIKWPEKAKKIIMQRGLGPAITIKEAYLAGPKEVLVYKLQIEFETGDDYNYCAFNQVFYIYPPKELEINFDQIKFNEWIKSLENTKQEEQKEIDLKEFDKIKKKYNL